ncbi:type I-E CRISPR-associated protein Cse1/CasA [Streptomyces sp. NPDC055400]
MDQSMRYDLKSEPWVGILRLTDLDGGTYQQGAVGLQRLLAEADQIKTLSFGPPPALSALYRILYVLTARVTGLDEAPHGPDEWMDRRLDILESGPDAEAVDTYFAKYRDRFDLFGSRPFLQDPRLPDECPKSAGVNKLVLGRPAGNNTVWWEHHFDGDPLPLPTAEAVGHLLMWNYYGPSGRCATRTVGKTSEANSSAGPLRSSLSYHPEGDTLWMSLLAGLTPPESHVRRGDDLCPWEEDDLPDPTVLVGSYAGPSSRLTGGWQHALLLVPDASHRFVIDAYITWGRRGKMPSTRDPYVIWQISQEGNPYPRPADSGRALWRDVDALLLKDPSGSTRIEPPAVFSTAADLEGVDQLRVRALGFEQDGKTKDVQFVEASTPPLLGLMEHRRPEVARSIGDLRTAGVTYGQRLATAVKRAWATINDSKMADCAWSEHAAASYWPSAEEVFWRRLRAEDFDEAWTEFRRLAERTFDQVTAGYTTTSRGARAVEHARLDLYGGRRQKKGATAPGGRRPAATPSGD